MNTKEFFLLIILSLGLSWLLIGCGPSTTSVSKEASAPLTMAGEPADLMPEQVTEEFYTWYLGCFGQPEFGQTQDLPMDGADRSSQYLTDDFVQQVNEGLFSLERTTYDPFLFTTVDKAVITGDEANVMVHEIWWSGTIIHDVEVDLERVNEQWKIARISEPLSVKVMSKPPYDIPSKQVVEQFYAWYLGDNDYRGCNPLLDKTYWSCAELTDGCVQRIDEALASSNTSFYDPFLCVSPRTPVNIVIGEALVSGGEASVVIHTNNFEGHQFTVNLKVIDGEWKISDILCGNSGT